MQAGDEGKKKERAEISSGLKEDPDVINISNQEDRVSSPANEVENSIKKGMLIVLLSKKTYHI